MPKFEYLISYVDKGKEIIVSEATFKGVGGQIILPASEWVNNVMYKHFEQLGDHDCIEFYPATMNDQVAAGDASMFVSATDSGDVAFQVIQQPVKDITLNYFITRGTALD